MNRRGSRLLIGYLLGLGLVSILLVAIEERAAHEFRLLDEAPPRPLHAVHPGNVPAPTTTSAGQSVSPASPSPTDPFVPHAVPGPTSKEMLDALARDRAWASGVRTLLDDIAGYRTADWKPPPAGLKYEGFPSVNLPDASRLDFVLGSWECEIRDANKIESGMLKVIVKNEGLDLAFAPGESPVQPLPRNARLRLFVEHQVEVSTWLSHSLKRTPITEVRGVSAEEIMRSNPPELRLTTLPQARGPFTNGIPETLPIRLRFLPGSPTDLSVSVQSKAPVVAEPPTGSEPFSGQIDYRGMRALEHVLVPASKPYLVCLVWSTNADLNHRLVCVRTDTREPIGRFVKRSPFFVAEGDGRASLLLSLFATSPEDAFDYHVLTVSAAYDPRKLAFLRAVACLPLSGPRGPVSRAEADETIQSLAQVLDVTLDEADLAFVRTLGQEGTELANYLARLTGSSVLEAAASGPSQRGVWKDLIPQNRGDPEDSWPEKIKPFTAAFAYSISQMEGAPAAQTNSEPFNDSVADPKDLGLIFRGWRCTVPEAKASEGVFRLLVPADDQTFFAVPVGQDNWVTFPAAVRAGRVALSIEWFRKGRFLVSERRVPVTKKVTVAVDQLTSGKDIALDLPVLAEAHSAQEFNLPATLNARLEVLTWSPDGDLDTVKLEPSILGQEVSWSARHLSFLDGQARAIIPVHNTKRFLAVAAIGNAPLRGRLVLRRLDTGQQVGAYAPDLPVLLAVADGRTSLEIHGICHSPADALQYRVLALAGPTDPRKALFFETLAQLAGVTHGRVPSSKYEIDRTVVWMMQALAVEFSRTELREAYPDDDNVAALFRYLDGLGVLR